MTDSEIRTDDGKLDFEELVEAVGTWSEDNFGDQPAYYPAKGACEEWGELLHSDLKRDQGIRLDDDDVGDDAERDAVGDIVIYLADTLYRLGEEQKTVQVDLEDDKDSTLTHVGLSLVSLYRMTSDDEIDNVVRGSSTVFVAEVLCHLRRFCRIKGYDFDRCVVEAWEGEVSDREWREQQ